MRYEGRQIALTFDSKAMNFSAIERIGAENIVQGMPKVPLAHLVGFVDGTWMELRPDAAVVTGEAEGLRIVFGPFGGRKVSLELSVKVRDDRVLMEGQLRNRDEGCEICELVAPHLTGIVLGGDPSDDVFLYPHHAGERTVNPVDEYPTERYQNFWRAGSVRVDGVWRREINYCGLASMSWMYLHDAATGLYIGSHDAAYPVTGLIAESMRPACGAMGFAFRKHRRVACGQDCVVGEYVLALSEKDWHYGAKIYREYLLPHLHMDATPDFLLDEYALNECYEFKRGDGVVDGKRQRKIDNRFADIPRLFEMGQGWGVRHFFMASWNRTGFDSYYPEYYPDMELGSAMEFARGLSYIREHGGFSTLYINARIFDVESDYHATLGERMAIRKPDGEPYREVYGPAHFTVNCPSDKLWRDYLLDMAEFTVRAYGPDGIYLDQLASAEPFACHAAGHSHEDIGEFNQGYLYILENLLFRLRKQNPNAYIMTENCGDIYGCYTWGNLTWNGTHYDEHYAMFKYTFPEFVQVNMVDPRGWVGDLEEKKAWFYKDLERAILLGSVMWIGHTIRFALKGYPEEYVAEIQTYGKKALAFRARTQPFIRIAAFLNEAYVRETGGGAKATCWQLPNGRVMLLCGNNALKDEAFVRFVLPFTPSWVQAFDEAGEVILAIEDNELHVPMGAKRLLCVMVAPPESREGENQ